MPSSWRRRALLALGLGAVAIASFVSPGTTAQGPRVLRVGSFNGIKGQFATIQAAVLAARPGDWILVGPGDYKESGYAGETEPAGVLITTPGLHVRGMNRNSVVVDGTRAG